MQRHPFLYPERVPWVTSESPESAAGDVVHELSGQLCGSFARLRRDVDAFVATRAACAPASCVGAPLFSTCRAYEIELHCEPSYGLYAKPLAWRYLSVATLTGAMRTYGVRRVVRTGGASAEGRCPKTRTSLSEATARNHVRRRPTAPYVKGRRHDGQRSCRRAQTCAPAGSSSKPAGWGS